MTISRKDRGLLNICNEYDSSQRKKAKQCLPINFLYFPAVVQYENLTGETMMVLGLVVGLVVLVSIVLMAIVGGSHVFD
jgi:hypothetical protein